LDRAAALLKPGGTLVYSTCTFNREENEETIAAFLDRHPEFVCRATERLWPHRQRGEGHFAALLYKEDLAAASNAQTPPQHAATRGAGRPAKRKDRQAAAVSRSEWAEFQAFAESAMPGFILPPGEPVRFGDAVYWLPDPGSRHFPPHTWTGLKVLRPGLHLFDVRKGRIEPAHALAMALTGADFRAVSRPPEDPFIAAYLRGESVPAPPGCPDGRVIVAVNGFPLGWGKTSNGQIKNHLPKALRRHIGE
jgi:NOL1/NOP2/fmu family ribosome biogenesis protein